MPLPGSPPMEARHEPGRPAPSCRDSSYNTGPVLARTVAGALAFWPDVLVVVDGSTDGSADSLAALRATHPGLSVTRLPRNRGKGRPYITGCAGRARAVTPIS